MKRKKKKLNKLNKNNKLGILQTIIKNNKNCFKNNNKILSKNVIDTNSWFNINETIYDQSSNINRSQLLHQQINETDTCCKKIRIYLNKTQRYIIKSWMDSYITMYNETLKLFKHTRFCNKKISLNFKNVRTNYMLNIKNNIAQKTKINKHILDGAIQDACSAYKSALTNLRNGNIKHFRLRYLKYTKKTKIIKIESGLFSKKLSTFCRTMLGDNIKTENNYNLSLIDRDCKLHYDRMTGRMILLVPQSCKKTTNKRTSYISLDPGIRQFMTGITENKEVFINDKLQETLKRYLEKIDLIKTTNLSIKKIKKTERKLNRKITNKINDMHWKIIKYLTENYKTILIGNLSTKNIGFGRNLNKMTKRIGLRMKLYEFKQRLKYKCSISKTNYGEIDEAYTSKTCSSCGWYNKDLGSNKQYNCNICKIRIDRDINGARNILLKGLKTSQ